jgi:hypothetical protein
MVTAVAGTACRDDPVVLESGQGRLAHFAIGADENDGFHKVIDC